MNYGRRSVARLPNAATTCLVLDGNFGDAGESLSAAYASRDNMRCVLDFTHMLKSGCFDCLRWMKLNAPCLTPYHNSAIHWKVVTG